MGDAYQIQDQTRPYFFTFQVVGWTDIFSRKIYRDIILESFSYCRKSKGMILFAYVVMTNHVHAIIQSENGDLSGLVRDFKKFTSEKILLEVDKSKKESRKEWLQMIFKYHAKYNKQNQDLQFWTHENHAIELFSKNIFESKFNYIHENPVKAGWVEEPHHYLYSSARNYGGMNGLIVVDMI